MTKKRYKITKIVLVIVVCFVIGYASWLSFRKVGDVYLDEMELTITGIKQDFLKNTVDNLIREIDVARELEANYYERVVDRRYETLSYEAHLTDEDFVAYFINRFRGDADRQTGPDYWTALLWNNISGEILYDPIGVFQGDLPSTIALLQTELRYFRTIDHGEVTGLWGVGSQLIEEHTQARVAEKIRNLEFDGGSYIWVNGVLNYDGGPDYAIRVVHPNFPETEGTYLSTETTDLKGNTPYLTELEGVKEHGELFFRYWFKKLHSDEISEKLTYARLYQDYDWIIAMGIHIDDMERYIAQTSSKSEQMAVLLSLRLVLLLMGLVVVSLSVVLLVEQLHFRETTTRLKTEMNKDPLTGIYSRRYGASKLREVFDDFKLTGASPAIMVFDLDRFKLINDTYGHEVGDQVLKQVVDAVQQSVHGSDHIARWGGDEFVAILMGLERENLEASCKKILEAVSSVKIEVGDEVIRPTISLGASYFEPDDLDYVDALRRADRAMYDAKEAGRNKARML